MSEYFDAADIAIAVEEKEMAMNDRQFAAAHDRLLEPPDEEFDDITDDECDLADSHKQEQRDREDWLAERLRQEREFRELGK